MANGLYTYTEDRSRIHRSPTFRADIYSSSYCFGIPEGLLSDKVTNLLYYLMRDIYKMLGITKLNTNATHPQCNGTEEAVERLTEHFKTMLRKYVVKICNTMGLCNICSYSVL